mmetsp:Transcript_9121/g.13730  ORF Transcript_9121/g.13730 Transcript_9121/m.13730 type:complete len:356 (-) Transcript_9121:201-1268(-)|eukprot:CAMPEP_0185029214 /NCGR_PEP_ID=MMETSP1103-20130426/15382_1 /TAXON_ID=36769 /ORGANISM="Paraphysomonas bandaiensis, Strain Caron Lab Isolate" /LENGTH=355 /DNA_ID=CAMNT_0027563875 /DNA_START=145 /DNA_END=1212 /DNA_ORIENTATION=+
MSEWSDSVVAMFAVSVVILVAEVYILLFRIAYTHVKVASGRRIRFMEYIGMSSIVTSVLYTIIALCLVILTQKPDKVACEVSIFLCIFLYASSKIQIYLFLVEKSHLVQNNRVRRSDSNLYKLNVMLLLPYIGVLVLMVIYRINKVDSQGHCVIGLYEESSIPLLIYDTVFSVYMLTLFLYPLLAVPSLKSSSTGKYAKKNLVGATISTVSSFVNIFTIYASHGSLRGHECLFYCLCDVFVNVVVLNWLLGGMDGCCRRNEDVQCISPTSMPDVPAREESSVFPDRFTQPPSSNPTTTSSGRQFFPPGTPVEGDRAESILSVFQKILFRRTQSSVTPLPTNEDKTVTKRQIEFVV